MKRILLGLLIVLIVLLIPLISKDRSSLIKNFRTIDPNDLGYTEISFVNEVDNITLSGMLFHPNANTNVPLVVFIHGSGYSNRTNPWYLTLTKHLLDNNIAVLLPDKRGSENSGGDWKGISLEQLAGDTEAALQYINNSSNTFSKIGVIGMSQGGWIAPIVASKNDLDFVINVSGSLSTSNYQLQFEERHNIGYYTYDIIANPISKLTVKNLEKKPHIKAMLDFDPLSYWKDVHIPNLLAYSLDDTNCPVERSLERADDEAFAHLQILTYPKGGHAISNENRSDYREDFLRDLITFIK